MASKVESIGIEIVELAIAVLDCMIHLKASDPELIQGRLSVPPPEGLFIVTPIHTHLNEIARALLALSKAGLVKLGPNPDKKDDAVVTAKGQEFYQTLKTINGYPL